MFRELLKRFSSTSLLIALFGLLLIAALWSFMLLQVRYEYAEAEADEVKKNGNLALAHEERALQLLREADQLLLLLKLQYEQPGLKSDLKRLVAAGVANLNKYTYIGVADAQGDIVAAGKDYPPLNIADRVFFKHHQQMDSNTLNVGDSVLGRSSKRWGIPLTRRINNPDGSFGGVAVIVADPAFFTGLFQSAALGQSDMLGLIRTDGMALAQRIGREITFGHNVSGSQLLVEQKKTDVGHFHARSVIDQRLKFYSYRRLKEYPLIVVVATLESEVLAPVRQRETRYFLQSAIASILILGFCCALIFMLWRQQRSREVLRISEESLATTLHSIGDAVIATDIEGRVNRMNPVAEQLTGWTLADAAGKVLTDVFHICHAQTRELVKDPVQLVLEKGEIISLANHTVLLARDGREHQIADSAAPIRDATGCITGVVLVFSDVTEQYRLRESASENQELFRAAFDAAGVGMGLRNIDAETGPYWLRVNQKLRDMLGYTQDEISQLSAADIMPADEVASTLQHSASMQLREKNNYVREKRYRHKDGRIVWTKVSVACVNYTDGKPAQLLAVVEDVSETRIAQESQARLAAIVDHSNDAIFSRKFDGTILSWNAGAEKMFGYSAAEAIGQSAKLIWPSGDVNYIEVNNDRVLQGDWTAREFARRTKDGRIIQVLSTHSLINDDANNPIGVSIIQKDVTALKQAEKALRERDDLFRAAFEDAGVGMAVVEIQQGGSRWMRVNQKLLDILGYTREELLQLNTIDVTAMEDRAESLDFLTRLTRGDLTSCMLEKRYLSKDGKLIWANASFAKVQGTVGSSTQAVVVIQDISDRKQAEVVRSTLETQLRESQKMQAIGTLAGGIAHDFNNMIGAILGNAELASVDVGTDDKAAVLEGLEEIRKAATRARDLVQQILAFSRRQPTQFVVVSLPGILDESMRLLRATLPARLSLDYQCAADLSSILADETQIEQVLLNLVTNAAQAIEGNQGRISVRAESVLLDEAAVRVHEELSPGRYVCVKVSDNGCGMDEATLAHIFEPFFSTKPLGEGTGLGLSVVHGIVKAHRGAISVESAPGVGSTFAVYLPESSDVAVAEHPAKNVLPDMGSGQHILYVDDDAMLISLVERLLQRRGYRVSGFVDQEQALAALRADAKNFDLVLTDYNMPGLSGLEVARAVRDIRADLPVVIATGYITDELRAEAPAAGVRDLIFKANAVEFCEVIQRLMLKPKG